MVNTPLYLRMDGELECVIARSSAHWCGNPLHHCDPSDDGDCHVASLLAMTETYGHHRLPGNFFIICLSPFGNEKSPCSPKGTRTENTFSAVPPCLPVKPTAQPALTRRVPGNAGNASEDTQDRSFSPCPRRPICCSAFRFPLSCGKLSVDALAALLPRLWFTLFA